MAGSSSNTVGSSQDPPYVRKVRKVNDALYELYQPVTGLIDMQIIFLHGFQLENDGDTYLNAWMRAEDSECWINTWLVEEFPRAHIMSVSYDSSPIESPSAGRMDMFSVGEYLAQSMIELAGIGQKCPVILVGHCIGGLVLKQVCVQAAEFAIRHTGLGLNPYRTFLGNLKGAFFYSTPNSGSFVEGKSNQKAPLLRYFELLSKEAARLNSRFAELRHRYGWETFGVAESNETKNSDILPIPEKGSSIIVQKREYSLVVNEGSARYDVDKFYIIPGEDHFTICKPRHRTANNFLQLVQFIRDILQIYVQIQRTVKSYYQTSLGLPTGFEFRSRQLEQIICFLHIGEQQPSRVALVGMGGIGKTTLAKAVLVQIQVQFDLVCFIEDVKGRFKHDSIHHLVADNLYFGNGEKFWLHHASQASLWLALKGKKVLLIMDDVESEEQIRGLLLPDWMGTGSRLIVTSRIRSRELLPSFSMFDVPFLTDEESEILFRKYFDEDMIRRIPRDLIQKIVMKCACLPLTLVVTASYLRCHKSVSFWKSIVEKLTRAESLNGSHDDRLWTRLRISYDDLAPLEQKIFLDLTVFVPNGIASEVLDLELWKDVWEIGFHGSSVESGLRNLIDRSLIHLGTDLIGDAFFDSCPFKIIKFWIHEQLRDLGKGLSRPSGEKPELCRGVWRADDVLHLLNNDNRDEARTEVVVLEPLKHNTRPAVVQWSSIGQLQKLRLLRLSNATMIGNEIRRFPCTLVYLKLTYCRRGRTGKYNFGKSNLWPFQNDRWPIRPEDVGVLHRLTMLHLDNCSSISLPHNFHEMKNLKFLIISGNDLTSLPDNFGLLPALKVLILKNVSLTQLPGSFSQLASLHTFMLTGCPNLDFNRGFAPRLTLHGEIAFCPLRQIRELKLMDLPSCTQLPQPLGLLESLETLEINRCSRILELPNSLGELKSLRKLRIYNCRSLQGLPNTIGGLKSLAILGLGGCSSLQELPEAIGELKSLEVLNLGRCSNLRELPEAIGELKSLEELYLRGCSNLRELPEAIGELKSLVILHLGGCSSLRELPEAIGELKSLAFLGLRGCSSLRELPKAIGELKSLAILGLQGCSCLRELPEAIGELKSLRNLHLGGCSSLRELPEAIGELKSLRNLHLGGCSSLRELPEAIGELKSLRILDLKGCSSLRELPEAIEELKSLENLHLGGCSSLRELPEAIGELTSLENLHLGGCSSLRELPEAKGELKSFLIFDLEVAVVCENYQRL